MSQTFWTITLYCKGKTEDLDKFDKAFHKAIDDGDFIDDDASIDDTSKEMGLYQYAIQYGTRQSPDEVFYSIINKFKGKSGGHFSFFFDVIEKTTDANNTVYCGYYICGNGVVFEHTSSLDKDDFIDEDGEEDYQAYINALDDIHQKIVPAMYKAWLQENILQYPQPDWGYDIFRYGQ